MTAKGIIIIISGPSGAGEDSIIDGLAGKMPLSRVVTTTTRSPRQGETEGNPYYFVSKEEFEAGIRAGKFFEYANHYNGNYYGVTFSEIERVKESDAVGIWKIDYKGVETAKRLMPNIKAIYIGAPMDVLEERIRSRDGVAEAYVAERMAYTHEWVKHMALYDYAIENEQGKLDASIDMAEALIQKIIRIDQAVRDGVPPRVGAGGVIVGTDYKIVVVANTSTDYWTLPKGGVDVGEDLDQAAQREIEEETGLTQLVQLRSFDPYYRFGGAKQAVFKQIYMFLYRTEERELHPHDPKNPEARWVSVDEAIHMMTHQEDRFFLERVKAGLMREGINI